METETLKQKTWDFANSEKDRIEVDKFYGTIPAFIICEFAKKFFIEVKKFNYLESYDELKKCYYYEHFCNPYFGKNIFNSLKQAKTAFIKYASNRPIYHSLNNE